MKATLEFSLPEEQEELNMVLDADSYRSALRAVADTVFRPARKHGYADPALDKLVEQGGRELVRKLEGMFYSIIEEYEVDPW